MTEKLLLIPGDKVKFVLTPLADFTKNYFVGKIVHVNRKRFCVSVLPSSAAAKKLEAILDSDGTLIVQFRCCQIHDKKAALAFRAELRDLKFKELDEAVAKKQAQREKWLKDMAKSKQTKKGKKKNKKSWQYKGRI